MEAPAISKHKANSHRDLSPFIFLLYAAQEFDFTRGGEGFKQRFATVTRNNYVVSRRSLMQKVRAAAGRVRRMLRKQS
jgi:hypothetical protein